MKRIGVLVCLMIMAVSVLAPACFAAKGDAAAAGKSNFKIESSTPEDGATGVAVENLSVKIYFDKEMLPESKAIRKTNAREFKLTDKKGKEIPIKVYYSHKEEGLLMVVSDTAGTDIQIQGNAKYTLTIGDGLQATDGTKLGTTETIGFKTLDQSKSTMVYMIMMGVMIVGMIFFTSRSAKKAAEKAQQTKGKTETVNPYKEAKRTGKSVEEIVERERQRKAKEEAARAKKRAKESQAEEELFGKESSNKRVSGPKPISATGSQYKVKVVKPQPEKKKSTNPKNQTGKQKDKKSGKGKKKK